MYSPFCSRTMTRRAVWDSEDSKQQVAFMDEANFQVFRFFVFEVKIYMTIFDQVEDIDIYFSKLKGREEFVNKL